MVGYAKSAFRSAWDVAHALVLEEDTKVVICLQYMYFYVHVTSRSIRRTVGDKRYQHIKERLVDACGLATAGVFCQGEPEAHWNRIRDQFEHQAAVADADYARFERLFADADEDTSETLVWQFGSVIAISLGKDGDNATITATVKSVTESLSQLDPDGFAKTLSRTKRGHNGPNS